MATKTKPTKELFIIYRGETAPIIRKYLSQVEEITKINANTLSKWFNVHKEDYIKDEIKVIKCTNVDLKGNYKNNFSNY
jgi:hypothetical protein